MLWPSFVVGGIEEGIFFTLFDPMDLHLLGASLELSRTAVYTLGFFAFWAFAAGASAFTCLLQKSAANTNSFCPLPPRKRPEGCPKRGAPDGCCD